MVVSSFWFLRSCAPRYARQNLDGPWPLGHTTPPTRGWGPQPRALARSQWLPRPFLARGLAPLGAATLRHPTSEINDPARALVCGVGPDPRLVCGVGPDRRLV